MSFIRSGGVRILLVLVLVLAFATGAGGTFIYFTLLKDLPDLRGVEDYQPPLTSRVLDRKGALIGVFANERRELVPLGSLPDHVGLAFVAAEDSHFFEHSGIDYSSILRAAWADLRAMDKVQGASTITMQLVKQMLLSPEKRFSRKVREMVLAREIESHFTKEEILYLYLNQIYFGSGAWGVGEAARTYFAKPAAELTISESALLAGLPQRPSKFSPFVNAAEAERKRRYVLGRMKSEEIISEEVYTRELETPPVLSDRRQNPDLQIAKWFTEEVRRYLYERVGGKLVLEGGLTIETTLDIDLQRAAVEAVRKGLENHDKRRGYVGPLRQVAPMDVEAEAENLAATNELTPDDAGLLPSLPLDKRKLGVVVYVDPESDTARVVFAPKIEGQVALADVSWAREVDFNNRPRPVKHIEEILSVGDVAYFIRLEGEPLVAPPEPDPELLESDEEGDDEIALADAEPEAPLGGVDELLEVEPPPLARVTIKQIPSVEGALLSMDVETGDVMALVGGYDYNRSQFNRATQAKRQPGSAFKPFIYGAALSSSEVTHKYTPVSILYDRPVVYEDPISGFVWRPQNYGRHFYGPMPMRQALVRSINNATVHLFRDLGVDYVIDYARRLGIQAPLSRDLSLALGSSDVGLIELTTAYAVFPNKGRRVIPRFITRVTDRSGNILLENVPLGTPPPPIVRPPEFETAPELAAIPDDPDANFGDADADAEIIPAEQIISEAAAHLMCDLLQAVVKDPRGTGHRLRKLGRPLGGKTGTTNEQKDAWFMGFSPGVVTGVWVGRDDSKVLGWGETGSRAAAPIWVEYMGVALAERPILNFEEPEGIITVKIDRTSGLLADTSTKDAYFQPFLEGSEPQETTTSAKSEDDTERTIREDFF